MTKITRVASARKAGRCEKCGEPIEVGQAYNHVQVGFRGRKQSRHATCPQWLPSELESNDSRAQALAAIEAAEADLSALEGDPGTLDDVTNVLEQCADGLREAAESWGEKADNIESGFGHETELSTELREKADTMEGAADSLDNEKDSLEDWDGDDEDESAECPECDGQGNIVLGMGDDGIQDEEECGNCGGTGEVDVEAEETTDRQTWWDGLVQAARDAVSNAEGEIP